MRRKSMKRRWNLALTAGICASLLMHGLVYDAIVVRQTQEVAATIHQPAFDLKDWLDKHRPPEPLPPEPDAIAPPRVKPPEVNLEELFGERGAKGKAANKVDGDQPMQARQADQEQASLTPHPGRPSDGGDGGQNSARPAQPKSERLALVDAPSEPPTLTIEGPENNEVAGAPLIPAPPPLPPKMFKPARPPIIAREVPTKETSPTTRSAVTLDDSPATRPTQIKPTTQSVNVAMNQPTTSPVVDPATTRPVTLAMQLPRALPLPEGKLPTSRQPTPDKPPTTRPIPKVAEANSNAHPNQTPMNATASGSPGHGPSGEAGNPSESESDEFSDHATVVFRNGRVEARDGRKVKSVRPKLTEAGRLALASMDRPVIVIKAKIDEHGRVTDATYVTSSGIAEVDQPHLRAAYEWVFEPTRDASGRNVPDTQIISFVWQ